MSNYQTKAKIFEKKWQTYWNDHQIYHTPNPNEDSFQNDKEKYVILDMFPYPSGTGLHIGHPLGYIATDIMARFQRMKGKNVLHAMGFDAFGLPAEQFAIQTNQHPRITTHKNIDNMSKQLAKLGLGHDPSRTFNTTDENYYQWTQWIFLQLFHSFYDPTYEWKDHTNRTILGKARPIEELKTLLKNQQWVLNDQQQPVAKSQNPQGTPCPHSQINQAINKARLACLKEVPVNWCPMLGSVLSNEEITNEGKSERGDYPVYQRHLKQWVLKITHYADRLLDDLSLLDWPKGVMDMQREWIGSSQGAHILFDIHEKNHLQPLKVYTTRPDTLFGATYIVLSPQHPHVGQLTTPQQKQAVEKYIQSMACQKNSHEHEEKTGVFLGSHAINPATQEKMPIWISDYVLMGYGTGAIMAVPSSDERDFQFAKTFTLPIKPVIEPCEKWLQENAPKDQNHGTLLESYLKEPENFSQAYDQGGKLINSQNQNININGLDVQTAQKTVIQWLEKCHKGMAKKTYKLRDWLFSRQRYWGEPFPIVFDAKTQDIYPLNESELPVCLPKMNDFKPQSIDDPNSMPQPPLARAQQWVQTQGIILDDQTVKLCTEKVGETLEGKTVRAFIRETNSMPNWAGSCWYYLRYFDAQNPHEFVSQEAEKYWSHGKKNTHTHGAVDLYVGGTEHAVLHLLYARFWHKVLFDLGHVSTPEPFKKLFNQGMITADAYMDERDVYVPVEDVRVEKKNNQNKAYHKKTGQQLTIVPGKMGKRYKNGVPPELVCDEYTIDTLRTYTMYLGPLDASKPWKPDAIIGMMRFLSNVWKLSTQYPLSENQDAQTDIMMHKTIKKVTQSIENLRMNVAISSIIEWVNHLLKQKEIYPQHIHVLARLISPIAPHMAEEILSQQDPEQFKKKKSAIHFSWPEFDEKKCQDSHLDIPIQINGKRKTSISVSADVSPQQLIDQALNDSQVQKYLNNMQVLKTIPVMAKNQPRLVNIVLKKQEA